VALETCFALIGLRFPVSDAEAEAKPLAMASGEILDAKFTDWVHANIASAGKADSPGGRSAGGTTRAARQVRSVHSNVMVFSRNFLAGVIRQQSSRDEADDRA
jgi:hypothetical protein